MLKIYAGRRILLTGHTGFKGSWLALWLRELGAEVTGYALAPEYQDSHYDLLGLAGDIDHRIADIRDRDHLEDVMQEIKPEFVFHLAAQALVRRSYGDPKTTFDTNVGGSVNLLEAVRACDTVRALVYITSDKAYRNKEWLWGYRENDELGGHDPYSASKAAAELAFMAFQHSYFAQRSGLGVASTRAGNVIGGGDWASDRIIPDCMRALRDGTPIRLRNPEATRPWQHVLDPLHGYLQLGALLWSEPNRYSGPWNFGPELDKGLTVHQVAERAIEIWGDGMIVHERDEDAPFEHRLLQVNIDKAKLELGWRPKWSSVRAIAETVDWYKRLAGGATAKETSKMQISAFMGE